MLKPHRRLIVTKKKLCCLCGGISKVYFDSYPTIPRLILYCDQLDTLRDELKQKRSELINKKCVVFDQDIARHPTSLMKCQKLLQLEWGMVPHPHSSDLETSDYYLFQSLQNFLHGRAFSSNQDIKSHMNQQGS